MATLDETKAAGDINELYVLGDEIGRGSFSTVRKGRHKESSKEFAVKCIQKKFIKMHLLEREIKIMKKLQHPHILPLIEVYESKESIYLVLELVTGGELFDKIVERGNYSESDASNIIAQILSAVEYLHSQGVVHRDLKPENLLCSEVPASATNPSGVHIYVADFGLSRVFQDREQLNTYCGSPEYVAPEVLACVPYEKAVDLWSVGVITYILLTGFLPFYDKNHSVLFEKIQNVDYNWDDCPEVSAAAKHFIQHLLVKDPKKRYPAEAALQHPWITREGVAKLQQRPSYQNLLKEINDKKQPKKT